MPQNIPGDEDRKHRVHGWGCIDCGKPTWRMTGAKARNGMWVLPGKMDQEDCPARCGCVGGDERSR
jgi:hypothetical protein